MQVPNFSQFAPVSKAEAAAALAPAGGVGAAAAPVTPATPAAPVLAAPVAPLPRFVGGKPRMIEIRLDCPVEYAGRVYESVFLRRVNAIEVGQFFERLAAETKLNPNVRIVFPIFVDEAGAQIPIEVLDFLDAHDDERLMEAAADFLPARLAAVKG